MINDPWLSLRQFLRHPILVGALLAARHHPYADVVVSGLPWAAFGADRQRTVLDAVLASLHPAGVLTTFAYRHALPSPPARRFRRLLESRFEEVVLGRTVWRNVP